MKQYLLCTWGFLMCALNIQSQTFWNKQASQFDPSSAFFLKQFSAVNAKTVWALASGAAIDPSTVISSQQFSRTTDGGATWTKGTLGISDSFSNLSMFALSKDTCFISVSLNSGFGGGILKTENGGNTWNWVTSVDSMSPPFVFIHFFNSMEGLAVSSREILMTFDMGVTWIPNNTLSSSFPIFLPNAYDALGNTIWLGEGSGRVFISNNKGIDWRVSNTNLTLPGDSLFVIKGLSFEDEFNGIAVGFSEDFSTDRGFFFRTEDGGTNWERKAFNSFGAGTTFQKFDIDNIPGLPGTYVISSGAGTVITQNFGDKWRSLDKASRTVVEFYDSSAGWCGSNISSADDGIFAWTRNYRALHIHTGAVNPDKVNIYPNPFRHTLNIVINDPALSGAECSVYDFSGRLVFTQMLEQLQSHICPELQQGLYTLVLSKGNETYIQNILSE